MTSLIIIGLLAAAAFNFFGPVGIIVLGVILLLKSKN